ncbi:hypothetical protein [Streptomyces sp. NPDC055105]|uniref:hypothetical protein n=1 Tax=Streptomyces sp. NPDC055105 TaxID=3365719 RepID=UPI0037D23B2D
MTALRRQTIGEALQIDGDDYRTYTAIHEIGHATAGLATGDCNVDHIKLTIYPGAPSDGYTEAGWNEQRSHLVLLHGGFLAQQRWMRERGLWNARRDRAARNGAGHDFGIIETTGASTAEVAAAAELSSILLDRHWAGLLVAADRLATTGYLTGDDLCAILNQHATKQ